MNRRVRLSPGLWGTVALSLAGAWLLLSPGLVGYHHAFSPWTPATTNAVVVGGTLLLVGAVAVWAQVLLWARDVMAAAGDPSGASQGSDLGGPPAPAAKGDAGAPANPGAGPAR